MEVLVEEPSGLEWLNAMREHFVHFYDHADNFMPRRTVFEFLRTPFYQISAFEVEALQNAVLECFDLKVDTEETFITYKDFFREMLPGPQVSHFFNKRFASLEIDPDPLSLYAKLGMKLFAFPRELGKFVETTLEYIPTADLEQIHMSARAYPRLLDFLNSALEFKSALKQRKQWLSRLLRTGLCVAAMILIFSVICLSTDFGEYFSGPFDISPVVGWGMVGIIALALLSPSLWALFKSCDAHLGLKTYAENYHTKLLILQSERSPIPFQLTATFALLEDPTKSVMTGEPRGGLEITDAVVITDEQTLTIATQL